MNHGGLMAVQSCWGACGGPTPGMVRPMACTEPAKFVAHDPELLEVRIMIQPDRDVA